MYVVQRQQKKRITGISTYFTIATNDQPLYTGKFKKTQVLIFDAGKDPRSVENPDAVLLIANEQRDYALRKQVQSDDILTIRFLPPESPLDNARKMFISFFKQDDCVPQRLVSKNPKLSADGKITHDFDNRFAIASVKNVVLSAKPDGPGMIMVRKAGPDALEVEVRFEHQPLWVFAVGMASYLTKVK
jgi:hypothetical protein